MERKDLLTKSRYLAGGDCLRKLHLQVWQADLFPAPSQADQLRMRRGSEVGQLGRGYYPGGKLLPSTGESLEQLVALTQQALAEEDILYEATLVAGQYQARVDVLVRVDNGWKIVEVKSSTSVKSHHHEDVAFQAWVARQTGLAIVSCSILHLNGAYEFPGGLHDVRELFVEDDVTTEVESLLASVETQAPIALAAIQPDGITPPTWASTCKDCAAFKKCYDDPGPDHVFFLPRIRSNQIADLLHKGVRSIADIEEPYPPSWAPAIRSVKSGEGWNSPDLPREISKIKYPAVYFDIESCMDPIPTVPTARPNQQIPVQWSCHVRYGSGGPLIHHEWIHSEGPDPRPEFVATLLPIFEQASSIVVYSAAERRFLKDLVESEILGAERLRDIFTQREVDLERIVAKNIYRFGFYGKTGLKKVLPVLAPDFGYTDLEIQGGVDNEAAYVRARDPRCSDDERGHLREHMLAYCARDTLALVAIHDALLHIEV